MPRSILSRSYLCLVALFLIQGLIFYSQVAEQIAPYYPRGFDQLTYFIATYGILNHYFMDGWQAIVRYLLSGGQSTGVTFPLQGALIALLGGSNRTAIVSLNLVYFIALEAMLFSTVLVKSKRLSMAWIAMALLMSASSIFLVNGGIYDYRIDFSAMCLYGIWVCSILRTDAFLNLRWSIVSAFVGVLLISMRYFTIVYLGTVLLIVFASFALMTMRRQPTAGQRMKNVFICGVWTLGLTGPLLFAARNKLYSYYGVGHFFGNEKQIRAAELGLGGLLDHLAYYPKNILIIQLGTLFLFIAAVLLLAAYVQRLRPFILAPQSKFDLIIVSLALVVPLIILNLDQSKSPVVGGITIVPVILLCLSTAMALQNPAKSRKAVAIVAVSLGTFALVSHATAEKHMASRQDLQTIDQLNTMAADYISRFNVVVPHLAFDRVDEFLNTSSILLNLFQRSDIRRPFQINPVQDLGNIFGVSRASALSAVRNSDIVVLTDQFSGRSTPYPFNESMREYWTDLHDYVTANLFVLGSGHILGIPYFIYVRPAVKVSGAEGGWITKAGVELKLDPDFRRFSHVVLRGKANYAWLGGEPKPRAVTTNNLELPSAFERQGDDYRITIDTGHLPLDKDTINLSFDRFFVPKLIGINEDTRELVLYAPNSARITP